jgi:carboxylesterase type B
MSKVQSNTFRYLFTPSAHGVPPAPTHSEEIEYVFANLGVRRLVVRTFDSTDYALSNAMSDAGVRFAATGDPNGGTLPHWPAYDGAADPYRKFGDSVRIGRG